MGICYVSMFLCVRVGVMKLSGVVLLKYTDIKNVKVGRKFAVLSTLQYIPLNNYPHLLILCLASAFGQPGAEAEYCPKGSHGNAFVLLLCAHYLRFQKFLG